MYGHVINGKRDTTSGITRVTTAVFARQSALMDAVLLWFLKRPTQRIGADAQPFGRQCSVVATSMKGLADDFLLPVFQMLLQGTRSASLFRFSAHGRRHRIPSSGRLSATGAEGIPIFFEQLIKKALIVFPVAEKDQVAFHQ